MMKKIVLLAFTFIFTSCVQNVGGKYEWFIEANQKIFDFSTPGDFTYNTSEINVANNTASIQVNYTLVDDFADDNYLAAWNETTIDGVAQSHTESSGVLSYDCQSGIMALDKNPSSVLIDYTAYVETKPTAFDIGQKPVSIIGRFVDNNNFYMAMTTNTTHGIYYRTGGLLFSLATVPVTLTLTTGTTYAQKFKLQGNNLYYKIWVKGNTEPTSWMVTTTDATHASGNFALSCYSGNGEWDNARNYKATVDTEYDAATARTIVFPEYTISQTLSRYESIEIDATISGSDAIKFDVSDDGGATFQTYSGGSWVTNGSGYAGALTLAQMNQYLRNFSTSSSKITFRAYLYSADGTTTPVFRKLTLTFSTQL